MRPIARVDIPQYHLIIKLSRDTRNRGIYHSLGRSHKACFDACLLKNFALTSLDLPFERIVIKLMHGLMRISVISNFVSPRNHLVKRLAVILGIQTNHEKGRLYPVFIKHVKYLPRLSWVRAVVKGKRDLIFAVFTVIPLDKIAYQPNTNNYMGVLEKIGYMTGTETVAIGLTRETMEKFGLGHYVIYFEAPKELSYDTAEGKTDDVLIGATEKYYLYISEKQEDGTYFVGSEQTNVVARVDGEIFAFLERSEAWWLKDTMYTVNIGEATKLEFGFNYTDMTDKFDFVLTHDRTDPQHPSLVDITYLGDGRVVNTAAFRNLYMHLLTCYYTGEYDGEVPKEDVMAGRSVLTLRVTLSDGEVYVYRYYPYSARHVLVSIAKEGEAEGAYFYILSAELEKIYRDIQTLLAGGVPDPEKQY